MEHILRSISVEMMERIEDCLSLYNQNDTPQAFILYSLIVWTLRKAFIEIFAPTRRDHINHWEL